MDRPAAWPIHHERMELILDYSEALATAAVPVGKPTGIAALDRPAIQAALDRAAAAGGGTAVLTPGVYAIDVPLTITANRVRLVGAGRFATILQPTTGFTGAAILTIGAVDDAGAKDLALAYASSNSATNPSAHGIQVVGGRYSRFNGLGFGGVNGYAIEITASASQMPLGAVLDDIRTLHTAGGIHLLSNNQGSNNFGMQAWISNANLEICDGPLDNLLIEDSNDVLLININGAAAQGSNTNSTLHIKGKCSTVYGDNLDLGIYPGPASAPTVLIEAGANGSPSDVNLRGTFQAGAPNIKITDGSRLSVEGTTKNASTHGAVVTNLTGPCFLDKLTFSGNNQAAGASAYDLQLSNTTNFVYCRNSNFASAVNATPTAGSVTRPVDDQNHRGVFLQSNFDGSGTTPSTVFQGTPQIVRGCRGYNPRGDRTAPSITFGVTANASEDDVTMVVTALNGATSLKLGGNATGFTPVAGVGYRIPARGQYRFEGTGTPPAIQWIAD